mgnify:CR=1 FL=1
MVIWARGDLYQRSSTPEFVYHPFFWVLIVHLNGQKFKKDSSIVKRVFVVGRDHTPPNSKTLRRHCVVHTNYIVLLQEKVLEFIPWLPKGFLILSASQRGQRSSRGHSVTHSLASDTKTNPTNLVEGTIIKPGTQWGENTSRNPISDWL